MPKLDSNKANAIDASVGFAKAVISSAGKKSLTRMSKDSIFQFPCIASSDIDSDNLAVLIKAVEVTYASMLVSVLSIEGSIDRSKYQDTAAYLRRFHTNTTPGKDVGSLFSVDSATINAFNTFNDTAVLESLWDIIEEQVDNESFNDIYTPFKSSKRKMYDALESMETSAIAMEKEGSNRWYNAHPEAKALKRGLFGDKNGENKGKFPAYTPLNNNHDVVKDPNSHDKMKDEYRESSGGGKVMTNNTLNSLEPTLINITLVNYNQSARWTQNVTLGVKAMGRVIKSSVIVSNMVQAAKDKVIFKFINWTKGEQNVAQALADLAGFKDAKLNGIGAARGNWLSKLRNRKKINNVTKFTGYRLLPNCTIIMTDAEVEQIKSTTGIDYREASIAKGVIDKYFLLGIIIYDTESDSADIIYDGDTTYTTYSMRALMTSINKDIILSANNKF
jgi:hypothetical protein